MDQMMGVGRFWTRGTICGVLAIYLAVANCAGCGSSGPRRVPASGTVQIDSKPLANGSITLMPTGGHQGPAANGVIVNGAFQIPVVEGPTVGPHIALVSLSPGKTVGALSGGQSTRMKWEVKVDVGENGFDHKFDLKSSD